MIEKLFEIKSIHILSELSGQIGASILSESTAGTEDFSSQDFR